MEYTREALRSTVSALAVDNATLTAAHATSPKPVPSALPNLPLDLSAISAGDRICVAVSGGADSTALLLALFELNGNARSSLGCVLTAVHVHHGLRGAEADADEAFVSKLCERMDIPFRSFRVDTAARQASHGEGLEEAARELRYKVFRELLESGKVDMIATAHTLDDQAETVIMKLLRGSWTGGLSGIAPVLDADAAARRTSGGGASAAPSSKGRIVRPLLCATRSEVEAFLAARSQPWREDATNGDMALTRNRVRRELMPQLRSFNPRVDEALANLAVLAREDHFFWEAEVDRMLPQLMLPGRPVRGGGRAVSTAAGERSIAFEIERLRAASPALRPRLLRAAAARLGCRLTFEETAKLLALSGLETGAYGSRMGATGPARPSPRAGARLELRSGLRAQRSARELRLWRSS